MQEPNHQPNAEAGVIEIKTTMETMQLQANHQVAELANCQKIETKLEASAKRSPQTNTALKQTATTTHPSIHQTTNAKSKRTGII